MDESVKLFQEEQERIADAGGLGPWVRQQLSGSLVGFAMSSSVLVTLMGAIGAFPRNADNSIKIIYLGPTFVVLGIISLTALRRFRSMPSWMRPTFWALFALSVVIISITLIDVISLNGS
ncbi:hypothetical protein [Sphingomonas xinjiangensis]|uniref:Uncharacterized protein n=1 Tax=Sphingomonas xinjiangensis TaxID=643568 RepID=A0A840YTR2_9SPHN|nr:hypothetical protein [Sphingomonas xinjiangensis]MBB5713109.1 hypothetical protein [Sphingomonas xinjiangensis]